MAFRFVSSPTTNDIFPFEPEMAAKSSRFRGFSIDGVNSISEKIESFVYTRETRFDGSLCFSLVYLAQFRFVRSLETTKG